MTSELAVEMGPRPRNIVIFSDGTGQRGGLYVDEERSNVYKLYRATRTGPDSLIDPGAQVAFYDPGLGTLPEGGNTVQRFFRKLYNFVSQATGLGITQNIIDCYAALIRLWRPGDRIFVFGFSRGAYTVRCLGSVICMCGIPTTDKGDGPLPRDPGSSARIASHAVKTIYQHVSSPRDEKYVGQRKVLAANFRREYGAADSADPTKPNAYPYFIGVFDTVASLANTGSLLLLCLAYLLLHVLFAAALAQFFAPYAFGYWFGWVAVWVGCAALAAYIYTHLKFAWRLPGHYFWDVIHLTTFRQKFYDQYLNASVKYARHAISIDERRHDFRRVPWGGPQSRRQPGPGEIRPFEQLWFAGNHVDVGGGYSENESRLSDIALFWMIEAASNPKLGEEKLIIGSGSLNPQGRADGVQHDEARSSAFRFAKKTLREPVPKAPLHPTVLERFALEGVQQYDVTARYRPEALRNHEVVGRYYADIRPPRTTCWQRIAAERGRHLDKMRRRLRASSTRFASSIYPATWKGNEVERKQFTPDSAISCVGLFLLAALVVGALWIFLFWQILPWLREGVWYSHPISAYFAPQTGWIGLQLLLDWVLALPLTLLLALLGIALFWLAGLMSAKLYQAASRGVDAAATPSQIRA